MLNVVLLIDRNNAHAHLVTLEIQPLNAHLRRMLALAILAVQIHDVNR